MNCPRRFPPALLAVVLGAFAGCHSGETPAESPAAGTAPPLLDDQHRLRLPPETRQALRIETASAVLRTITPRSEVAAEVFATGTNEQGEAWVRASAFLRIAPQALDLQQPVFLQRSGRADAELRGFVVQSDDEVRAVYGQTELIIQVPNPEGGLAPGAVLQARLLATPQVASVAVPRSAMVHAALGDFVYVSDSEGLKRRRVMAGVQDPDWMEIREGLAVDEQVVTRGAEALWLLELSEAGGMTNIQ